MVYTVHLTIERHWNGTTISEAEHKSEVVLTKDTLYLILMGELLGVYCQGFEENEPNYDGTTLY